MTLPPRNPRPGREFPRPAPEHGPLERACRHPSSVGPGEEVGETSEPCAVPQCADHAVGTLRVLVEGYDAELPMCGSHGNWVRAYIEEDVDVLLLDRLREVD